MTKPFDHATTTVVPRATIEQTVECRDRAIELYGIAYEAIDRAALAMAAAHAMVDAAAPGARAYVDEHIPEIAAFHAAVRLPERESFLRTARRLTDLRVWSSIIERTDLERLMDKQAKDQLREQMRYVPDRVDRDTRQVITEDEAGRGLPPVTVGNVTATLQRFMAESELIFRRGVANAFSKLDRRFRSHDGFKIGGRIILTYAFNSFGHWNYGRDSTRDTLMDIERAFAVMDGETIPAGYASAIGAIDASRHGVFNPAQSEAETQYFRVRIFKNGNAHLWFTRPDLVEKVNKLLADHYGETLGDARTEEPDPLATPKTTLAKNFGFYPTPAAVVRDIASKAMLLRDADKPPLTILEPSAGTGNLARACLSGDRDQVSFHSRDRYRWDNAVDCVEVQPELADGLRREGVYRRVTTGDFLAMAPDPTRLYDRVVMNPPFDRERDIDHVVHALKFLKPDGFLVAIMSAGIEFRETRKSVAFRELIASLNGAWSDLPPGSFAESGTWVNTVVLRVWKDGREVRGF